MPQNLYIRFPAASGAEDNEIHLSKEGVKKAAIVFHTSTHLPGYSQPDD